MFDVKKVDEYLAKVESSLEKNGPFKAGEELKVGVDLGTAYIVLVVLNQDNEPVACNMQFAQVLKDGLVVDYIGAVNIVRKLKNELEKRLGVELTKAAIAVPPGTSKGDTKTHINVVEACELEVTEVVEEPTAANAVLNIDNGVIVDIGGGTTGLSVIRDKEVIFTADEATGGTHVTLVLSGSYKIDFEEAEVMKKDPKKYDEVFMAVVPVIQKMATIVKKYIEQYEIENVYLVGGTCCLKGVERVFEKELGIKTYKPHNPFLVTPVGIAMNC
ncbi:MAG: ethanolamine utilization protein EutJ [Cellulosilyticaceae bacterium]